MLSKQTKRIIAYVLMIAGITTSIFFGVSKLISHFKEPAYIISEVGQDSIVKIDKESVVKGIKDLNELSLYEKQVSRIATLSQDKWYGNKTKKINYYLKHRYYVDLSNIDESNVIINHDSKTINLWIAEPQMETIILTDKTEFKQTDNSWMSFGDFKLSAEDYNKLETEILNQSKVDTNAIKGIEDSKVKLAPLITQNLNILSGINYTVNVHYVK